MRKLIFAIVLLLTCIFGGAGAYHSRAQGYPGAAIFSVQCMPGGAPETILFYKHGSPFTQLAFSQIATPLAVAVAIQHNQPITTVSDVSIWALKSDELQIHVNTDPDGTKLVMPSAICGTIPRPVMTPANAQAIALAQSMGGQAAAYALVTADCRAIAIAEITGPGMALAYVQSSGCLGWTPSSNPSVPAGARTHTVQPGENLFRISLRYGTTVAALSLANGITNPALIYVGQVIVIP